VVKKTDQTYQYAVESEIEYSSSQKTGLWLKLKGVTIILQSNFPLTQRDIDGITKSLTTEIGRMNPFTKREEGGKPIRSVKKTSEREAQSPKRLAQR
jgi:hypothetical protein